MTKPDNGIDWDIAREVFRRAFRSSFHYAIATIGEDGAPHITPIGSVLFNDTGRGIFFDIFSSQLSQNLDRDPRVCVMAVDSAKSFWLASLVRGRFTAPPALRLTGTVGPRRPSTPIEQQRWLRRVRPLRRLRGHQLLWGDLTQVRDLTFHTALPVHLGTMTKHLKTRPPHTGQNRSKPTEMP
jgi:hypothetical protein